ncbi:MAG: hypothetical protein OEV93_02420 [Candidatus Moranbacteria bacterium]|nr:hypothetical protein [Candidatus Moranbacteria bacterium]
MISRRCENPIIGPRPSNDWESKATFNPAIVEMNNKIHILYRAIGDRDVSNIGYATSEDGVNIDERLDYPVYIQRETFEGAPQGWRRKFYCISPYMSGGGGYGGCEDPKATVIDGKVYMTYVAYDGWSPPRLAMTHIKIEDFLNKRWTWSSPVLISKPNMVSKSGAILPEKIDGKYVIFHRVFPDILIDFVDSLEDFDGKTKWLSIEGAKKISPRKGKWDAGKLSVGAPPIKTKDGWLVIYHATTGLQEIPGSDLRYKVGAMLLDAKDPSKVLCRTEEPILVPETYYENEGWKYGIAYPCGAAILDDRLMVYYGGSDEFVCVAEANLDEFLDKLKKNMKVELKSKKPIKNKKYESKKISKQSNSRTRQRK